jgi:hypothetical protein
MSLFVETASGSSYQFIEGKMRRVNAKDILRRDAQWVEFFGFYEKPEIGEPLIVLVEDPAKSEELAKVRVHVTTPVTKMYDEEYLG